jgi:chemotaxis methyl-accepting protein methylase
MSGDMEADARPRARLEQHVDALLARLVSVSGFARGALSRERLLSHLSSRVHAGGRVQAAELAAKALADRDEYARIEALFSPPETWLFRYPESFDFLRARAARPATRPGIAPLRAFLAGCGGWCEPVSVAVALMDGARATGRAVEVVATDRNAALLAQRPVFAGLAVRGGIPAWASPHLQTKADAVEPDAAVLRVIRTRAADVVEAAQSAVAAGEEYDVVAFRNVAIYLDDAMRRRAFAALARIVAPDGVLLVGHAEMVAAAEATGFVAVEATGAFALARATVAAVTDRAPADARIGPRVQPPAAAPRTPMPSAAAHPPRATPAAESTDARASADPATFVATAIASERAGDIAAAERAIGRALYLDRTHEEALVIAARLATARGAHDEAERFRARAMRAHLAREKDGRREDSR